MQTRRFDTSDPRTFLLTEDVAAELGIAVETVRGWLAPGRCQLPHVKPPGSGRIFIPRQHFEAWLAGPLELEEVKLPHGGRVVRPVARGARKAAA